MLRRLLARFHTLPDCGTRNERSREEWLKRTLAAIPAGSRILDAGAGESRYRPLCSHLEYVSQDFGEYDGRGDGVGLQTGDWDQTQLDIVSDIARIPEPDASFDAIMCIEVFEHLPAPLEALEEFSRLLRPGGLLVLTAPFCSLTHLAPYHFYSGFNAYFFEKWLRVYGLKPLEMSRNGNFFEYVAQELRRIDSVGKKYGRKEPETGFLSAHMERWALRILMRRLSRLSATDEGSSELLCFGYHVLAERLG